VNLITKVVAGSYTLHGVRFSMWSLKNHSEYIQSIKTFLKIQLGD